ncbi:hypothetical protein ACFQAT_24645 [Undibacterium arcticum]
MSSDPGVEWTDLFTLRKLVSVDGKLPVCKLLDILPVALLYQ